MAQQIALDRFIPTTNWQAKEIRTCPDSYRCCRDFDSRGWGPYDPVTHRADNLGLTYNDTHYWGPPLFIPSEYRNITAGVLARFNETAWTFLPDCSTSGMVDVAYLPDNSGRVKKVEMMSVLGTVAAGLLAMI